MAISVRKRFSTILVGITGATAIGLLIYAIHFIRAASGERGGAGERTTLDELLPEARWRARGDTPPALGFYDGSRHLIPRDTFCLVLGAEGTGSTWVSRLVPASHRPPAVPRKHRPDTATALFHDLWSSGPLETVERARETFVQRVAAEVDKARRRRRGKPDVAQLAVLHVSAPDFDTLHYPDLHSSLWRRFHEAGLALRVIVTYRDPAQAAYSNHRRRWHHLRVGSPLPRNDIVCAARSTEKHMALLSAQMEALAAGPSSVGPGDVLAVSYHRLLEDPRGQARRMARYLGLDPDQHRRMEAVAASSRRAPRDYARRLTAAEVAFLRDFFDAERSRKWRYLREAAAERNDE